jgi:NADH pyrophosphatase NudC (nudix superfamily)
VLVGRDQKVALTRARTLALVPVHALRRDARLTLLGLEPSGAAVFACDALGLAGDCAAVAGGAPEAELAGDCAAVAGGAPEAELAGDCAGVTGGPPGARFVPLRTLAAELSADEAALAAYAVGMVGWHRVHRHCGRCGHATEVEHAGHRRRCPACGLLQFPRTDPAVTMLVQAGEHCLLSRRRGAPEHRWSALAGFVEPGESLEEAVAREAREETGVEVVAVEYVTSQPWPFPAALMIGFWAFADPAARGGALQPEAEELVDARWFERGSLRDALAGGRIILPPPGTIGNYLISTWIDAG